MTDEQAAEHYYRHHDEIEREPGEPLDREALARGQVASASWRT